MAEHAQSRWLPEGEPLGAANLILVARSRRHAVQDFPGPLSIKTVTEGRVAWKIQRRQAWVDPGSFLILHDGEPYSMDIDTPRPVSTCCVFFQKNFVETIARDLSSSSEPLLDNPQADAPPLTFLTQFHPLQRRVAESMAHVRRSVQGGLPASSVEAAFVNLARELLLEQEDTRARLARIPSARAATRAELLARVSRGRESLHSGCFRAASLHTAARAAGMSFYHFHRTFVHVFGKTPARYVAALRFERAADLLRVGTPVTEVCFAVGFSSLGSFSAAFHRYHGKPPSALLP